MTGNSDETYPVGLCKKEIGVKKEECKHSFMIKPADIGNAVEIEPLMSVLIVKLELKMTQGDCYYQKSAKHVLQKFLFDQRQARNAILTLRILIKVVLTSRKKALADVNWENFTIMKKRLMECIEVGNWA